MRSYVASALVLSSRHGDPMATRSTAPQTFQVTGEEAFHEGVLGLATNHLTKLDVTRRDPK